jgi:hypothetical protein
MKYTSAFAALALGSFAGLAQAQLIVGNDQSGVASIYDVNPTTGVATPIYTGSDTAAKAWGMAYDAATNTLYWNNGGTLFSSPLGATLTPTNRGALTFNGAATNYVALSFSNGKLYGTRNITTEAVYDINLTTLDATIVYQYASTFDFGGLDHDATNGKLYGLTDAPSTGRGLYEFNLAAQTETFRAPYPAGETDIDALAVNNGLAYYVTDGPNTTQANFYIFDAATGAQVGTIPSPFTGGGTFSAATWAVIPEPSALALLGLGGIAAMRRRRR